MVGFPDTKALLNAWRTYSPLVGEYGKVSIELSIILYFVV